MRRNRKTSVVALYTDNGLRGEYRYVATPLTQGHKGFKTGLPIEFSSRLSIHSNFFLRKHHLEMVALPYRQQAARVISSLIKCDIKKTMNLNALRYFLEVAKCRSIRRASERLHVAASAISRQVSALEHELGCILLERRSDGVSLTEAGERLLAHGLKIDAQIQLVQSDIDELQSLHRGVIKIATVEGITEHFLPQVLSKFLAEFPDVSFEVIVLSRDETLDALDRYECDIGFLYDYQHHHAVDILANYSQPLHGFVPVKHPLAEGTQVNLAQLLAYDHVLPSKDFGISQLVTRVAKKYKAKVAPKLVSNRLHFLSTYAVLNNAVVFMPVQAVYSALTSGQLLPVNLDCKPFQHRNLSMASRRQRILSSAASLFAQYAQDQFDRWQLMDQAALECARSQWLPENLIG